MAIKFDRDLLRRIIDEELSRWAAEQLSEAPKARTAIAGDDEEEDLPPVPGAGPEEQLPGEGPAPEADGEVPLPDEASSDEAQSDELPTGDEPADDAMEPGSEESGAEEGTVAADLEGRTIESVSIDEDSKIMPGATEVVLTFRESDDALRLLVSKNGKVKVFYKGLHNDFSSPVEEIPGEEPEEDELGADEEPGAEVDVDAAGLPPEGVTEPPSDEEDEEEDLELP